MKAGETAKNVGLGNLDVRATVASPAVYRTNARKDRELPLAGKPVAVQNG